ncbi:MAG: hypothetical protein ABR548_03635 [Actinomycetota bacterium]
MTIEPDVEVSGIRASLESGAVIRALPGVVISALRLRSVNATGSLARVSYVIDRIARRPEATGDRTTPR